MKSFNKALVASAVALACSAGTASAQWTGVYAFGDSSTDAGWFKPVLPPNTGRFTTNPDPVWAQIVAERYGFTANPANQGGTNYAQGGAFVAQTPGYPPVPPTAAAQPLTTQVSNYIAQGVDPGALHFVSAGYNDIFLTLQQAAAGQITTAQAQANIVQAATRYVQQVGLLQAAGAQNLAVLNIYDLGKSPYGVAAGPAVAAQISQIVSLYNTTVQSGLNALGGSVMRVDAAAIYNDIIANASAIGLSNTRDRACGSVPSLVCTPANLVAPNANTTYLYADDVHPTGAGFALLAQAVASMIEGPQLAATLTEGPLAVEQATFRAVDARMWSALDTPYAAKGMNVWASYDFANPDIDVGRVSGDANLNTLSVGGDVRVSPHLMAGAAAHFSRYDASYAGGGHELDEVSASIYGGWGSGPWYVGGSLIIGTLDYSDVERSHDLGALTRTGSGDTSGTHWGLRALGGYWLKHSNVLHGPFAKLVYQDVSIDGFSEGGGTSTSLRYGEQDRDSLIASVGWQAQGSWGALRPFGRVTWEYEFKDDERSVTASPSAGGAYTIGVGKPDDNWFLFNFGASMDFGQATASYGRLAGYLMGSATAGKGDGDSWSITAGIRLPM
jgi:outer membrane lipase/esterase